MDGHFNWYYAARLSSDPLDVQERLSVPASYQPFFLTLLS